MISSAQALAALIEFVGSLIIAGYAARSILDLLGDAGRDRIRMARLRVSQGVLLSLQCNMVAALVKALTLHSWLQIGTFVMVLVLRTTLKQFPLGKKTSAKRHPVRLGGLTRAKDIAKPNLEHHLAAP